MKTFQTKDGKEITRLSRWIKVRTDYNITERHSLYYYANDCGDGGKCVDYFIFRDRKYAIGQFFILDYPIFFEDTDGKTTYLCGYDCENYYNPLLIEIADCGEYVRVYSD